jgi:hypothetical protein
MLLGIVFTACSEEIAKSFDFLLETFNFASEIITHQYANPQPGTVQR